jgi:hypothetical protein
LQVWSNLACHSAQNNTYSPHISNADLLKRLQPAADFAWRQRFAPSKGKLTGGILLYEWLQVLKNVAAHAAVCDPADGNCTGAPSHMVGGASVKYSPFGVPVFRV